MFDSRRLKKAYEALGNIEYLKGYEVIHPFDLLKLKLIAFIDGKGKDESQIGDALALIEEYEKNIALAKAQIIAILKDPKLKIKEIDRK